MLFCSCPNGSQKILFGLTKVNLRVEVGLLREVSSFCHSLPLRGSNHSLGIFGINWRGLWFGRVLLVFLFTSLTHEIPGSQTYGLV